MDDKNNVWINFQILPNQKYDSNKVSEWLDQNPKPEEVKTDDYVNFSILVENTGNPMKNYAKAVANEWFQNYASTIISNSIDEDKIVVKHHIGVISRDSILKDDFTTTEGGYKGPEMMMHSTKSFRRGLKDNCIRSGYFELDGGNQNGRLQEK